MEITKKQRVSLGEILAEHIKNGFIQGKYDDALIAIQTGYDLTFTIELGIDIKPKEKK